MDLRKQEFNYVGKHSEYLGDLHLKGITHIAGIVRGNVQMMTSDLLIIEPTGLIEGNVQAENLKIYGEIQGDIKASGLVEVYSTGKIKGQLKGQNLSIKPGAQVNLEAHTGNDH